jgi:hypothetical protein
METDNILCLDVARELDVAVNTIKNKSNGNVRS